MKTILDYLIEHKRYEHDVKGRAFDMELIGECILLRRENGKEHVISANQKGWDIEIDIQNILEHDNIEIRFCEECGKPFDAGFIAGDGDWYCCGSCFDDAMDKTYGEGQWRPTDEEGEYGGYYENFDGDVWVDTSIYYTEWY
jgi:hypothetical protein